jgi:hypothetical protein
MLSRYVLNHYPYPQVMTAVLEYIHHVSQTQPPLTAADLSSQHHRNWQLVCRSRTGSVFSRTTQPHRESLHRHWCPWPMRREHSTHSPNRLWWTLSTRWTSSYSRCRLCICLSSRNHDCRKLGQITHLSTRHGDGNGVQGQRCQHHSSVSLFHSG